MFGNTDNEFIVTEASRIASGELRMNPTRLLQIGIAGSACAAMLFASDFWKTKDYTTWTDDETNKVLSDSPWAKAKTVEPQRPQMGQRGGGGGRRGGGFGFPGGGGIGFPGGGGGGGYPGGGGGYPQGGGGGYPGGGSSNGGNNGDPAQNEPMNLTIRWESALPIQHALMRRGASASDELKAAADATEKYYVIEVLGLRMPRPRSSSVDANDPDDNGNGGNNNGDDRGGDGGQRRGRNQSNDALRSQLLDAAQLAPKGKSSIYAAEVQIEGPGGIDGVRFLFPRTNPLSAGDKEVDFILDVRRIKVDEKFKLSDMQYQGKLAL
jgi:hypothetical protein